jgi:hypothetical protein
LDPGIDSAAVGQQPFVLGAPRHSRSRRCAASPSQVALVRALRVMVIAPLDLFYARRIKRTIH